MLELGDQCLFQKGIVVVVEPHLFNYGPSFCIVDIISHNVHLLVMRIISRICRNDAGGENFDLFRKLAEISFFDYRVQNAKNHVQKQENVTAVLIDRVFLAIMLKI